MKKNKKNKKWLSKYPDSNHTAISKHMGRELVESTHSLYGQVHTIGDEIERECGFVKRELILRTNDYKPTLVCFEFLNKAGKALDGLSEEEKVKVTFRVEGKEWQGKVLNNLIGTKVERLSEVALEV
jgi:hypothetical protein